jgi:hypothetical protein
VNGTAAGGHFDLNGNPHGRPTGLPRHSGDLVREMKGCEGERERGEGVKKRGERAERADSGDLFAKSRKD